jgi:Transposase DNA-binding/Transposase Tn5 dimerisation domain
MDVAVDLAQLHFGLAQLGDQRRTRRLVKAARTMLKHPGGTLPEKLGNGWSDLMGIYRLFNAKQVTHEAVFAPHRQRTIEAIAQHQGVVLLLHDSTELNYTHCKALSREMGQIGPGHGWGFIAHHSLAVTPQGQVLGLVNQILHSRRRVSKTETPSQKRNHPDRESRLWVRGCQSQASSSPQVTCIDIADRGSDTMEFISFEHAHHRHYVIRSARNRTLDGEDHLGDDRIYRYLHDYVRDQPVLGTITLDIAAKAGKHKARQATLAISAVQVSLIPRRWARGEIWGDADQKLRPWVIRVVEINAPPGIEPLEWILLSDLPADTLGQASQLCEFYSCRPMIEDLHKGMKTGLGIEQMQLEQIQRLEPAIALLSIVATLLLQLRHAAREPQAQIMAATTLVPLLAVQILSVKLYGQAKPDMSVKEFLYGVARLGGHLGRRGDGPPGWLTLWRGWSNLQLLIQGAEVFRQFSG